MDKDITNWQNLWKEEKSTPLDISKLIKRINKIERKGKWERISLFITIPITLIALSSILPIISSLYFLFAIVLIGIGMLMIFMQLYRSKFSLIHNDAELNNQKHIHTIVDKLKKRMQVTSKYMWFYTFLLIAGLNIGYIDILPLFEFSTFVRLGIHLGFTLVMFAIMYFSIEKRKKKNNAEIVPLIEMLESLK